MKLLHEYDNGNAHVKLYDDGTREITTEDDGFNYAKPLNIDVNCSNRCLRGCKFCYNGSTPDGDNAPIENFAFLDSMIPGTEVSLSTGSLKEFPEFSTILYMCKEKGVVANATFNQDEFVENFDLIKNWQDKGYLHGIGVSYSHADQRLAEAMKRIDNAVLHVINGVFVKEHANWIIKNIKDPKVLILGYKTRGFGIEYYYHFKSMIEKKQKWLYDNLEYLMHHLYVISFDNKALEQLDVKRLLSDDEWETFYQGSDNNGEAGSMYIDAVTGKFAKNSISDIKYDLTNDVEKMFSVIKSEIPSKQDVHIY